MKFATIARALSCGSALSILFVVPVDAQLAPPSFDPQIAADPSRDNSTYRTLFCSFKAGGTVWTLDLHVPRSGSGICHLAEAIPTIISGPEAARATPATAVPATHQYRNALPLNGVDEVFQAASIVLGNLRTNSGQLFSDCKLLTGTAKGIIVVNRQGIYLIPRDELDSGSLRVVQSALPAQD